MKKVLIVLLSLMAAATAEAQSFAFGLKGGLTIGVQQWNAFERDPLFSYHGIAYIESLEATNAFSVFAQLGYHVKGSAIRNRNFIDRFTGEPFRLPVQKFLFNNLSLVLGGKQKFSTAGDGRFYYLFGIRGDYNLSNNLDEYKTLNEASNTLVFPIPELVQKWTYGVTVGGGLELPFSELVGGLVEFTVNPDFAAQYKQPTIPNVYDPFRGTTRTIQEKIIRNITFELTVGLRFLRIVEYVD